MKTEKYSAMAIAMLVSNLAVIICGIFFFPQLSGDIFTGAVLMGILLAISIVLLIVGLRRKAFIGAAKSWLLLSYIVAVLVLFRWIVTIVLVFANGGTSNGAWGSLFL